jgi:hypothetical protein
MSDPEDSIVVSFSKIEKFCQKVTIAERAILDLQKQVSDLQEECAALKALSKNISSSKCDKRGDI